MTSNITSDNYREKLISTLFPSDEILKEPGKINRMDFYHNLVTWYDWHNTSIKNGAHFTPIFFKINKVRKLGVNNNLLESIERRTVYVNILNLELEFIQQRYNWDKFPKIFEMYLSRFENYNTMICELLLLVIKFYQQNKYLDEIEYEVNSFGEILRYFRKSKYIPKIFKPKFINASVNYSMYIGVRNAMVHEPWLLSYKENNQNPYFILSNIESRWGLFNEYLKDVLNLYCKKKTADSLLPIEDPRFPFLRIQLQITNKCNLNKDKSIVGIEIPILDYSNKILNDLFILQRELFKIIIKKLETENK